MHSPERLSHPPKPHLPIYIALISDFLWPLVNGLINNRLLLSIRFNYSSLLRIMLLSLSIPGLLFIAQPSMRLVCCWLSLCLCKLLAFFVDSLIQFAPFRFPCRRSSVTELFHFAMHLAAVKSKIAFILIII